MFDLNGILPLIYLFLFPYAYIKLSFTNIFCLMEFAENRKLERASCHFYSYFDTNYFARKYKKKYKYDVSSNTQIGFGT